MTLVIPPARQLCNEFINDYASEVVHPEREGKEQFRSRRLVATARHALHVLATLLEERHINITQVDGDFLSTVWLPPASTYTPGGSGNVHPLELNKRAAVMNSFMKWLVSRGYPMQHVKPLPLTFSAAATPAAKEQTMSDYPQTPTEPVAMPQPVPAPPPPPPMPPAAPPQPAMYLPQQPPPPPAAAAAPPAPPAAPRAPGQARGAELKALITQLFPARTERIRVWIQKPDAHGTGVTLAFVGDAPAENVIEEQGIEPFLLKHFVPRAVNVFSKTPHDMTFEVMAVARNGEPLSPRSGFTVGVPQHLMQRAPEGQATAPAPVQAGPVFVLQGRRYRLVEGQPVPVDDIPTPAPQPPQPQPAQAPPTDVEALVTKTTQAVLGTVMPMFERLMERVDNVSTRRGSNQLDGLDFDTPAPRPPQPEPMNPLAMLEAVERIVDKRMNATAPATPPIDPMAHMKQTLDLVGGFMQLTQPRQINFDTSSIEERLKMVDAKIERATKDSDPLAKVAETFTTMRSIFSTVGVPMPGNLPPPQPKSLAEVVGDVLTTVVAKLPETVASLERLANIGAVARQNVIQSQADRLRARANEQRPTQPPIGAQQPRPLPPQEPKPKPTPTEAMARPQPQGGPAMAVVTPKHPAYRTPGEGNMLPEVMHQHIFKALAETDRNLRLASALDLFAAMATDPELLKVLGNIESLLSQARYMRVVEVLTHLLNQFGYRNVTTGVMLGLVQDFVRFAIEDKRIDPRTASDFLSLTADSYIADMEREAKLREQERQVRTQRAAKRGEVTEEPQAEEDVDDEEGDMEDNEDGDEYEDEGIPALGPELNVVTGSDVSDDEPEEHEEPEEPEQEEPEPQEEEPEPEPEPVQAAAVEEQPQQKKRRRRHKVRAMNGSTPHEDTEEDAEEPQASVAEA